MFLFSLLFHLCRYVGGKLKQQIIRVGPEKVFALVFDGGTDFTATAAMIQELWPWISCLHCSSHEVSLIAKECFKEDGGRRHCGIE